MKLFDKLSGKKKTVIIIALAAVGLVLIFVPVGGAPTSGKTSDNSKEYLSVGSYTEHLEERVKKLCLSVSGIEDVTVLLTLESGSEYIYAANDNRTENDSSLSSVRDYLLVTENGDSSPVPVVEIYPKIRGLAIVCNGGNSPTVQKKLTDLLSAGLGIQKGKIMISG